MNTHGHAPHTRAKDENQLRNIGKLQSGVPKQITLHDMHEEFNGDHADQWDHNGEAAATQEMVSAFEKEHPDEKLEAVVVKNPRKAEFDLQLKGRGGKVVKEEKSVKRKRVGGSSKFFGVGKLRNSFRRNPDKARRGMFGIGRNSNGTTSKSTGLKAKLTRKAKV